MKCNYKVILKEKRRVGSGKPYTAATNVMAPNHPKYATAEEDTGHTMCGGNITAAVSTSVEGSCGCCGYAELEIEYKCDKCGGAFYKELPTTDSLSDFLTVMIGRLTTDDLDKMAAYKVERERIRQELYSYHGKGATGDSKRMRGLARQLSDTVYKCGLGEDKDD